MQPTRRLDGWFVRPGPRAACVAKAHAVTRNNLMAGEHAAQASMHARDFGTERPHVLLQRAPMQQPDCRAPPRTSSAACVQRGPRSLVALSCVEAEEPRTGGTVRWRNGTAAPLPNLNRMQCTARSFGTESRRSRPQTWPGKDTRSNAAARYAQRRARDAEAGNTGPCCPGFPCTSSSAGSAVTIVKSHPHRPGAKRGVAGQTGETAPGLPRLGSLGRPLQRCGLLRREESTPFHARAATVSRHRTRRNARHGRTRPRCVQRRAWCCPSAAERQHRCSALACPRQSAA